MIARPEVVPIRASGAPDASTAPLNWT